MPKLQPITHDSAGLVDNRLASRYSMRVPVELFFENGDRLRVFTHDVSASGIFVSVEKDLQVEGLYPLPDDVSKGDHDVLQAFGVVRRSCCQERADGG